MVEYKVERTVAEIGRTGKKLTVTQWNSYPAKLDLRTWKDGKPGKGMTLSDEEAEELYQALGVYLHGE